MTGKQGEGISCKDKIKGKNEKERAGEWEY